MIPTPTKRPACPRCERPQSTCICHWITPIPCDIEILILQHPTEVHNAKGSARLLNLCLPQSRLFIGEKFPDRQLEALLYKPFDEPEVPTTGKPKRPVLLYPAPSGKQASNISSPCISDTTAADWQSQLRLVIVDGTWRKSRKMLYLNPMLQKLPRLTLGNMKESLYKIRKAHEPHQLSTLEATCHALIQLEKKEDKYRPILSAFEGFVEQQLLYREAGVSAAT